MIMKGVGESVVVYFQVLFFPETEENHEKFQSN